MKEQSKSESPLIGERSVEEILADAIEIYNASVNDLSKFQLNNRELRMFVTAMEIYASQFKSKFHVKEQMADAEIRYLKHRLKAKEDSLPLNFWKRLEMFVSNVEVNDPMSEEEKEMILRIANQKSKPE